jgi:hypothetical protein
MEAKFIRALATLGVPGVALGIFYLLLRGFNFQFSQIDPIITGLVAVLFLLLTASITAYALHLWRPVASHEQKKSDDKSVLEIDFSGERVVMRELLHSLGHDVVKIDAHTHQIGVAAEYTWVEKKYPGARMVRQLLKQVDVGASKDIYFDVIVIELPSGGTKEIYFDLSSFYGEGYSTLIDRDSFIAKKIKQLYNKLRADYQYDPPT